MNRLEARRALRDGDVIGGKHVGNEVSRGRLHTYTVDICKSGSTFLAIIRSNIMFDRYGKLNTYRVSLTTKQVLAYIRRHYPIKCACVEKDPFREVA